VTNASRDTASGNFIAEIDGLRFIAIFSVIFFHIAKYLTVKTGRTAEYDPLIALFMHGDIGVQLFFIISGFVIALPFAKGHLFAAKLPKIQQYFFRRLTRLEPPYIINLIICFILTAMVTTNTAGSLFLHLLASMGYLHNIIYADLSTINVVTWSLEVELQFYVLAPLIASVFKIRSKAYRRGLIAVFIVFFSFMSVLIFNKSAVLSLTMLNFAHFFLAGFLLVDIYLTDWNEAPLKSLNWDVVSILSWFTIVVLLFQGEVGRVIIVVPMLVAYCAAFQGIWSNRFFCKPIIYIIGGMCYTIYLYHYMVISSIGRLLLKFDIFSVVPLWIGSILLSILFIPLIMVCCTLLFILIEKPFMKKDWFLQVYDQLFMQGKVKNISNKSLVE
jgi:peptidoglycan/LPS O-acetylase OafA/YrhL